MEEYCADYAVLSSVIAFVFANGYVFCFYVEGFYLFQGAYDKQLGLSRDSDKKVIWLDLFDLVFKLISIRFVGYFSDRPLVKLP